MKKMRKVLSFFVLIVTLFKFCFQEVYSLPPHAMNSQCNCIRAKDCVTYSTRLLNSNMDKLSDVTEQVHNAGCGFTAFSEPMLCCPTRMDSFDFISHHNSNSMKDRWIWERRPQENKEKSNGIDIQNKFLKNENQFIGSNLIDDYVDWKTHRNCPPILFKESKNRYHKHFRWHRISNDEKSHSLDHFQHDHPFDHFEFNENKEPHEIHHHSHHYNIFDEEDYGSNKGIQRVWPYEILSPQRPRLQDKPETTTITSTTFATITKQNAPRTPSTTGATVNSPNCGVTLNKRIIGGIESLPGEFPWITRIAYLNQTDNSIAYRCTGSFVSEFHILTAAHCVTNLDNSLSLSHISLIDSNANDDCNNPNMPCKASSNQFEILETIVHPNYDNPKRVNDIAIIKIIKSPNTEVNYGTICLPNPSESNPSNSSLIGNTGIVAGWSNNEGTESNDLRVRYLRLSIMNNTDCADRYNLFREGFTEKITIVPSMVCTQGQSNGSDVCRGDSGGPLMDDGKSNRIDRYTLLGIVAFGPICGFTNLLPGVYMRISEYVNWIIMNIER